MRHRAIVVLFCALAPLGGQTRLAPPSLGYVAAVERDAVRPIIGIPGASVLKGPIDAGVRLAGVTVSPRHTLALAIAVDTGEAVRLDLTAEKLEARGIAGVEKSPSAIVFSPSGDAAVFYSRESGRAQVVLQLAAEPEVREALFLGDAAVLALSDDGNRLLYATRDAEVDTLHLYVESGSLTVADMAARGAAFFAGSHDAVVVNAATRQVLLLRDSELTYLASIEGTPVAAATNDANQVIVAATEPSETLVFTLEGEIRARVACPCTPALVAATSESGVYRLTEAGGGALRLLDLRREQPLVLFVPDGGSAQ